MVWVYFFNGPVAGETRLAASTVNNPSPVRLSTESNRLEIPPVEGVSHEIVYSFGWFGAAFGILVTFRFLIKDKFDLFRFYTALLIIKFVLLSETGK